MSFNFSFFSQSRSNQRIEELERNDNKAFDELQELKQREKANREREFAMEKTIADLTSMVALASQSKSTPSTVTGRTTNPTRPVYRSQSDNMAATSSNVDDFLATTNISTIVALAEDLPSKSSSSASSHDTVSSSSWSSSSDSSWSSSSDSSCSDSSCGCD